MSEKIPAYDGSGKYVFVSYSHKDSRQVYPVILSLYEQGYNVWYDEGIPLVVNYGGELYRRIRDCSAFLLFVSKNSVASVDVDKEVENAFALKKKVVRINIDNSPMRDSWNYHIPATSQYISIGAEPGEFYTKLRQALAECRCSDSEAAARNQHERTAASPAVQATEANLPASAVQKSGWVRAKEILWSILRPVLFASAVGYLVLLILSNILLDMIPYDKLGGYGPIINTVSTALAFAAGGGAAAVAVSLQKSIQRSDDSSPTHLRKRKTLNGFTWGSAVYLFGRGIFSLGVKLLSPILESSSSETEPTYYLIFDVLTIFFFSMIFVGVITGIVTAVRTGKEKREETLAGKIVRILCLAAAVPAAIDAMVIIVGNLLLMIF